MAITDLTGHDPGISGLVDALGGVVTRLDPDHPLRKIIFPATYEERVRREAEETLSPEDMAQVLTQPERRALAEEEALPLSEEAELTADIARSESAIARQNMADAERNIKILNQLNQELGPQEAAKLVATGVRAQGAQDRFGILEAERAIDFQKALEERGVSVEDEVDMLNAQYGLQLLQLNSEAQGLELEATAMNNYADWYSQASPKDKELAMMGLTNPTMANYLTQSILQEERFEQSKNLAEFRARFETAGDPLEREMALVGYRTDLRQEQDRILELIQEAEEEGNEEVLEGLVEEFNTVGESLMRLDPASFVRMASQKEGFFGGKKAATEFDLVDTVMYNAQVLTQSGMDEQTVQLFRDSLTDSAGNVNETLFQEVLQVANDLSENRVETAEDEVVTQTREFTGSTNPEAVEEVERLQAAFDEALATGEPGATRDLFWPLWKAKFKEFISRSPRQSAADAARVGAF